MLTTRVVYLVIIIVNMVINGLGLVQHLGYANIYDGMLPAALVFNLVAMPVLLFAWYRIGELAEEDYLRTQQAAAQLAQSEKTVTAKPSQPS